MAVLSNPSLWLYLAIAAVVVVVILHEGQRWARFEESFPPISDEEFVARCAPGANPVVALRVRRIFADYLGVPYERIYPSSTMHDLGGD